jgi:ribonuclease HI
MGDSASHAKKNNASVMEYFIAIEGLETAEQKQEDDGKVLPDNKAVFNIFTRKEYWQIPSGFQRNEQK